MEEAKVDPIEAPYFKAARGGQEECERFLRNNSGHNVMIREAMIKVMGDMSDLLTINRREIKELRERVKRLEDARR